MDGFSHNTVSVRHFWSYPNTVHFCFLQTLIPANRGVKLLSEGDSTSPVRPLQWWMYFDSHMVRLPRCVFINYNWINQLPNTIIWWLDICSLLHKFQLHVSALMVIFRLIDWQQTCKQLYFGMRLCVWWRRVGVGWGYEILCVLSREGDLWPSSGW